MNKGARYIVLLIIIGLAVGALYRTFQWYYLIPHQAQAEAEGDEDFYDPRDLLKLSEEELDVQTDEVKKQVNKLKKIRKSSLSLGLDLQGGVHIVAEVNRDDLREQLMDVYDYDEAEVDENFDTEFEDATERALQVLKNRMDQFGVTDPDIVPTFEGNISIELPGMDNPQMIRDALSKVGKLEFHLVDEETMDDLYEKLGSSEFYEGALISRDNLPEDYDIPEDSEWIPYYVNDEFGIPQFMGWMVVISEVSMDGTAIKSARVDTAQYGGFEVGFELSDEGTDIFADLTKENIDKRLAIILDDKIKSYPNINSEIVGSGKITGNFTLDEASFLANILKAGSLPVKLDIVEERVIGPTLGHDSIQQGTKAFLIGVILVIVFMIIYYKFAGFISIVGLAFNIFFLVALLAFTNATLTLAGIAGIALTVGMAVDANVIIYQRIREEMGRSRSFKHALENGYNNASKTIWDANLTTFIAAFALSLFGTGNIKGFGITLSFGIISNIFAALFITRLLFDTTLDTFKLKKISI